MAQRTSSNAEAETVRMDDPDGMHAMLTYHAGMIEKLKARSPLQKVALRM
jgi:hypothetical protein